MTYDVMDGLPSRVWKAIEELKPKETDHIDARRFAYESIHDNIYQCYKRTSCRSVSSRCCVHGDVCSNLRCNFGTQDGSFEDLDASDCSLKQVVLE